MDWLFVLRLATRLTFWIQILFQFVSSRRRGRDAVRGHFHFREPHERVEDELAEIVVAKIFVEVQAGETEAAPAIGPLDGPRQNFFTPARRDNVRIGPTRR